MIGVCEQMTTLPDNLEPSELFEIAIEDVQKLENVRVREFVTSCLDSLHKGGNPFECLDLQRSDLFKSRKRRRNYWICTAYSLVPGKLRRPRCEDLEQIANIFETTVWPQWRNQACPPDDAMPIYRALFNARRLGEKIPGWRRLMDICVTCDIAVAQLFIKVPSLTSNRQYL